MSSARETHEFEPSPETPVLPYLSESGLWLATEKLGMTREQFEDVGIMVVPDEMLDAGKFGFRLDLGKFRITVIKMNNIFSCPPNSTW